MNPSHTPDAAQRDALRDSFREATADEPETFRDDANADKVVEIPDDNAARPIHGIDPAEQPER